MTRNVLIWSGEMRRHTVLAVLLAASFAAVTANAQQKPGGPPSGVTTAKPAAALAPAATATSWDGHWNGSFGARTDMVVMISGEKITGISLLGQPLAVTSSSVSAGAANAGGPDFSLSLTRVAPNSAQGTYENNRKEKATALFSRN